MSQINPCALTAHGVYQAEQLAAQAMYFRGQASLFCSFTRSSCRQFAADAVLIDQAVAGGDWATVRRLAHSLKSVLRLLGLPTALQRAERLIAEAQSGHGPGIVCAWAALGQALQDYAQSVRQQACQVCRAGSADAGSPALASTPPNFAG